MSPSWLFRRGHYLFNHKSVPKHAFIIHSNIKITRISLPCWWWRKMEAVKIYDSWCSIRPTTNQFDINMPLAYTLLSVVVEPGHSMPVPDVHKTRMWVISYSLSHLQIVIAYSTRLAIFARPPLTIYEWPSDVIWWVRTWRCGLLKYREIPCTHSKRTEHNGNQRTIFIVCSSHRCHNLCGHCWLIKDRLRFNCLFCILCMIYPRYLSYMHACVVARGRYVDLWLRLMKNWVATARWFLSENIKRSNDCMSHLVSAEKQPNITIKIQARSTRWASSPPWMSAINKIIAVK